MKKKISVFLSIVIISIFFAACAAVPPPPQKAPSLHYDWGSGSSAYAVIMRAYLEGIETGARTVSIDNQIARMRLVLENVEKKELIPEVESADEYFYPGFFAHLGLLYAEAGNRAEAVKCYEKEKELFPDSAPYMDFMIDRNRNRNRQLTASLDGAAQPRSILIMPAVNATASTEARAVPFSVYPAVPLANAGYYVIPVTLSALTFLQNGATIAEEAHLIPPERLRQIFGADAALYTTITTCGIPFLSDSAEVTAAARLVDLRTGRLIWSGSGTATESLGRYRTGSRSILGAIIDVASAVYNASNVDYSALSVSAAGRMVPSNINRSIGYGPYHPLYSY